MIYYIYTITHSDRNKYWGFATSFLICFVNSIQSLDSAEEVGGRTPGNRQGPDRFPTILPSEGRNKKRGQSSVTRDFVVFWDMVWLVR